MPAKRTLHLVSLGCPKNRVDSEVMLGIAAQLGFAHVDDPARADVIVVNTCGFIDDAKKESIDTILELARFKKDGVCSRLVVAGCLAQRYAAELAADIPELDHLIGSGDVLQIGAALDGSAPRVAVQSAPGTLIEASAPRVLSSSAASAYVKIAEGCDRQCAFCIIPSIRGNHRSRTIEDVVTEVESLVAQGVLEVNLVSQDTVSFGRDRGAEQSLAELVRRAADVNGIRWLRVHYLYPDALDDELIDLLANHPSVVPYVDMPMQHASDAVLKRMRRGHGAKRLRAIVERLRTKIPNLAFRSAFIVGFPGETDEAFGELCDFVKWARFDHVGVFRYSDEENTHAVTLSDKVSKRVAYNRFRKLMAVQRRIAREVNRKRIGTRVRVLVEGASDEHEWVLSGRHAGQAPEIDGQVYFTESDVQAGQLWDAEVVEATDYDLVVRVVGDRPIAESRAKRAARVVLPVMR